MAAAAPATQRNAPQLRRSLTRWTKTVARAFLTRGTKTVAWALARATYAPHHPKNTAFFHQRKSVSHSHSTFVPRVIPARPQPSKHRINAKSCAQLPIA
jgi:hypothetical protein